jgi:chemotaxis protein histidine kinase CheA
MMIDRETLLEVQDDLCLRVQQIEIRLPRLSRAALLTEVHSIKGVARAYGLTAMATLAHHLESAIAGEAAAALVTTYLDRMVDALGCNDDPQTIDTLLASVNVRLQA